MKYGEFRALSEKPVGLAVAGSPLIARVPLDFAWSPEELLEQLDSWGSFDDDREVLGIDSFQEDLPAKLPHLVPFATPDLKLLLSRDPSYHLDSRLDFVLFVDTSLKDHPVILFGCGRALEDVAYATFEEFYSALEDS